MTTATSLASKMQFKLATEFTTDALINLVVSTGIASDTVVSTIQEQALNVLEDNLSEERFLDVLNRLDAAIDADVDCSIENLPKLIDTH